MDEYKLGSSTTTDEYAYIAKKGLTKRLVGELSASKNEPEWMREERLKALTIYESLTTPEWGADLSELKWDEIHYYLKSVERPYQDWKEVPSDVKRVFDAIGVPEAEREHLSGVTGQYDSEKIYGSLKKSLSTKGVVFLSMDEGLREYPEIVKKYWGSVVPAGDNKLAALNTAVWSGGSFVYVPRGVEVKLPLQAYFRINAENAGQFERTMIVVEEGASVNYVEGCSAPAYSSASLHSAVVEVIVKKGAKCRYTTVQNWYKNVYNLVTKRAEVGEKGRMEWVDCNIGSCVTMKYPACLLKGEGSSGSMLSIAVAGSEQQQDTGAKMYHLAPNTSSEIISKSISKNGGRASYRGLVMISPNAAGAKSKVVCDALILDPESRSDTYPTNRVMTNDAQLEHEAYASKVSEEETEYLMSRGMTEGEAQTMIVRGFLGEVIDELPMEYAVELNRLVKLEMEGSVG
jgi:Fe-S cluster assembly protein SufB